MKEFDKYTINDFCESDILDFWAEFAGGEIRKDYHSGVVVALDWGGSTTYPDEESAASDLLYTIIEWAKEGEEAAIAFLQESGF